MEKDLTKKEIHENFRKELWCKVYIAYVSAANATKIDGGSVWADAALEKFDKRFEFIQNNICQTEK